MLQDAQVLRRALACAAYIGLRGDVADAYRVGLTRRKKQNAVSRWLATLTLRHNGRFAGPETRFFGIEAASDIDRGELFVAKINEALGLTQDRVSLANEEQ